MNEISSKEAFEKFRLVNCVLVIAYDEKNRRPSGMVVGYVTKCSNEPPLLAVSLSKSGYTHKLIQKEKEFVIAVPNKAMERDVIFFGSNHGDVVDKFKETNLKTLKSKYVKAPLIEAATVNFECKLMQEIDCGDHILFIGKVLASYADKNKGILLNMRMTDCKRNFSEFI